MLFGALLFWVDTPEVLAKLRASPVQELWIDTRQGLEHRTHCQTPVLSAFATDTAPIDPEPRDGSGPPRLCAEASDAVMHMFSEARMGQAVDLTTASTWSRRVMQLRRTPPRCPDQRGTPEDRWTTTPTCTRWRCAA